MPANLRTDIDVVLAAVKQCGEALKFASDELWSDCNIVMDAVKQDGEALEFALHELRSKLEIVWAAVNQNRSALPFQYASDERSNREFAARESIASKVRSRPGGPETRRWDCLAHGDEQANREDEHLDLSREAETTRTKPGGSGTCG